MSKQDRQAVRNITGLEYKYNFGKTFAELQGLTEKTRKDLEEQKAITEAELSLRIRYDENGKIVSMLNAAADVIKLKSNRLKIESDHFTLTPDGTITATAGTIGGCSMVNGVLEVKDAIISGSLTVGGLQQKTDALSEEVRLLVEWQEGEGNVTETIAEISAKANANEASIKAITTWQNSVNGSISSVTQKASANESAIKVNAANITANSVAIADVNVIAGNNSSLISDHAELLTQHTSSIADTKSNVNTLNATVSTITKWMGDETEGAVKTLAEVYQTANVNTAAITSITSWQSGVNTTMARLEQESTANGAKIGMVVKSGANGNYVDGSILVEAINGQSTATIKADKINLVGYLTVGSNISDLKDDVGYAMQGDIPTKTSDLVNDSDFATIIDVKKVLSDLTDDIGYQTEDGVVSIVNGIVTADYIRALGLVATSILSQNFDGSMSVSIDDGQLSLSQYYNGRYFSGELNAAFYQSYNPYNGKYFFCGNGNASGAAQVGWSTNHYIMFGENAQLVGTWLGTSSAAITSDAGKKHDIQNLDERYSLFFDSVRPVAYKYNDGTSGRYHTGFIANEVEAALTASGISTQEFAGFVKADVINKNGETENINCLRYEEFIAVLWQEVQKLKEKVQ